VKTPLGIHCSIIAKNVLSKLALFHQHICQTKLYPVKKLPEAKNYFEKQKGFRDGLSSYSAPQKKAKKHWEMPLPSLGTIPLKKCRI